LWQEKNSPGLLLGCKERTQRAWRRWQKRKGNLEKSTEKCVGAKDKNLATQRMRKKRIEQNAQRCGGVWKKSLERGNTG